MDLLYWIGGCFGVLAFSLLMIRWMLNAPDPREWERDPQPWSDPSRFGEDD